MTRVNEQQNTRSTYQQPMSRNITFEKDLFDASVKQYYQQSN